PAERARAAAPDGRARAPARREAHAAGHRRRRGVAISPRRAARGRSPAAVGLIVHVDTSALVDALTGPRRSLDTLIELTNGGHRLALSTIVLYEWLRGPRARTELASQEELFPSEHAVAFGPAEAAGGGRACHGGGGVRGGG